MFEKVNPKHPDKVADRIAGALVDLAYTKQVNPKIAVEVLIGHGTCHIIAETSEHFTNDEVNSIVQRLAGETVKVDYQEVPQNIHLANNQATDIHCGDNGIFCGCPVTTEQSALTDIAEKLYEAYNSDGKYILDADNNIITICQSNADSNEIKACFPMAQVNPLGDWTGGIKVDSGATNRKLGSDMGDAVTGGGLHGKDLSKADVSINIYCHLKAQELGKKYQLCCAIGDATVDDKPYSEIVEIARNYIKSVGGFEKFAE